MEIKKVLNMSCKALTNPSLVPPYLKRVFQKWGFAYPLGYILMQQRIRSLEEQTSLVRELENQDEFLLIVLDACRYDRLEHVFDEYFTGNLDPVASAGYNTFEYVRHNWPDFHDITYVTGAAPITSTEFEFDGDTQLQGIAAQNERLEKRYDGYRPVDHISDIVEVWRSDWDESLGVCPPEPVTDAAIENAKTSSQLVVHYFQPHVPYIGEERALGSVDDIDENLHGGAIGYQIWNQAKNGDITTDELHTLYDSNLNRVLDSVCHLIHSTDFDNVFVMGDHGEALGELGIYGHPHFPHPYIRTIPWAEIDNVKKNSEDALEKTQSLDSQDTITPVEDRLKQLGYL